MKQIRAGTTIRISDTKAREKLAEMCRQDLRPYSSMLTLLINKEWERRNTETTEPQTEEAK